jgi:hypothetical protein
MESNCQARFGNQRHGSHGLETMQSDNDARFIVLHILYDNTRDGFLRYLKVASAIFLRATRTCSEEMTLKKKLSWTNGLTSRASWEKMSYKKCLPTKSRLLYDSQRCFSVLNHAVRLCNIVFELGVEERDSKTVISDFVLGSMSRFHVFYHEACLNSSPVFFQKPSSIWST